MSFPAKNIGNLQGHQGHVLVCRFNGNGQYCLTGGDDRKIILWNPYKQLPIQTYEGHSRNVLDIAVSKNNAQFVSVGFEKYGLLWDVSSGRIVRKFYGHYQKIDCVAFNENNEVVVTGSSDMSVRLWDLRDRSKEAMLTLQDARDSITSLCLSGNDIISGSVDGTIRTYDIRMGLMHADVVGVPIISVASTKDGNCTLVSTLQNKIVLLDKETGGLLNEYSGHNNTSLKSESRLDATDNFVFAGSEDSNVYIWDMLSGKLIGKNEGHTKPITTVSCHPTQQIFLSGSLDGKVLIWSL